MIGTNQLGTTSLGNTYVDEDPPYHPEQQTLNIYIGSQRVLKLYLGTTEVSNVLFG